MKIPKDSFGGEELACGRRMKTSRYSAAAGLAGGV